MSRDTGWPPKSTPVDVRPTTKLNVNVHSIYQSRWPSNQWSLYIGSLRCTLRHRPRTECPHGERVRLVVPGEVRTTPGRSEEINLISSSSAAGTSESSTAPKNTCHTMFPDALDASKRLHLSDHQPPLSLTHIPPTMFLPYLNCISSLQSQSLLIEFPLSRALVIVDERAAGATRAFKSWHGESHPDGHVRVLLPPWMQTTQDCHLDLRRYLIDLSPKIQSCETPLT